MLQAASKNVGQLNASNIAAATGIATRTVAERNRCAILSTATATRMRDERHEDQQIADDQHPVSGHVDDIKQGDHYQ